MKGAETQSRQSPSARGRVIEALPNALFRVELENQSRVLAHIAERSGKDFLRLLPGDRVQVQLSPKDQSRGRIVERCR